MASHWILQREKYKDKIELSPDEEEHTVGRGDENIIKFLSPYVSRKHCKIIQRHGRLTIIDLKSANGTYVNRTRILAEREIPLREGDLIGIGVREIMDQNCFIFELLCRRAKNDGSPVVPLSDFSTANPDIIVLSDSDSQDGMVENREAKVKVLKRLGEQMNVIKSKIPRLEDPDSELAFKSNANFSNELLNKENISQVQNSEPSSEKSCRQHVKKINVEIRADDDVTSEKPNRERAETVILNSRSDGKCKFESAQDYSLRTSNVNNKKTNPMAACKDEKNHYLDNISNSSDLNLHQPGADSSSSKPCVSESVFINVKKEQSDQTTEGYIKQEEEESNKFKQSSVKNSNKRTERNVNLDHIHELEGKIWTLLEAQPELKTLLEQLMKLKNSVASCEPQIEITTEKEYETKPSTSKMHNVINKDELNKVQGCITNKTDYLETNVDCERQTLDNAQPSTSKISGVRSQSGVNKKGKHTTLKAGNSVNKPESHANAQPSTSKISGVRSQNGVNKNGKHTTLKAGSSVNEPESHATPNGNAARVQVENCEFIVVSDLIIPFNWYIPENYPS